MNFYVPGLGEISMMFWDTMYGLLWDRGRVATDRLIQALLWEGDSADPRSIIVGEDLPGGEEDDPVLVILESEFLAGMMMFVCTRSMFLAEEPPVALAISEHVRVVEFDAE
jgi:hypothetical protein